MDAKKPLGTVLQAWNLAEEQEWIIKVTKHVLTSTLLSGPNAYEK